ncbi:MAG: Do family serine endopeptidase [Planctomycetaceae bacterium]|nr:MAG: Do family serine endopeptidase [Planctomycetaceae bacterium]
MADNRTGCSSPNLEQEQRTNMSTLKRNSNWIVGMAGAACLTLAAVGWAQRGPVLPMPADPQALAAANNLSQAFRVAAKNTLPAIVAIETRGKAVVARGPGGQDLKELFKGSPLEDLFKQDPRFREFFDGQGRPTPQPRSQGMGSGFIIDSSGVILTANHVVADAEQVKVRLGDGREYIATEVKTDSKTDVAIVRIQAEGPLPTVPLGNSDETEVGDWVLAIGSPFGLEATVTAGIISAKGRGPDITEREDFLQTDAAINPGNSGGPLINLRGEVIGINTAISTRSGGYDGVGFAVPINLAHWVGDQLVRTGKVTRAYLGVAIQQIDDKLSRQFDVPVGRGALVSDVLAGSPAAEGGLEVGDLVLKFNGREVRGTRDLQGIVERCEAGKSYPMQIVRDGKEKTLSMNLKEMPQNFSLRRLPGAGRSTEPEQPEPEQPEPALAGKFSELGLEVDTLTADVAKQLGFTDPPTGVVITSVAEDGLAHQAGLREGMMIDRVGNTKVKSAAEFAEAVKAADLQKGVLLLVKTARGGSTFIVLKK